MSSNYASAPGTEEQEDAEYNKICEKHTHLIETLPKASGWWTPHLHNYNGFWISPMILKTNLLLHAYFKSHPTDIFLASFVKCGTTWLKALIFSTLNRHRYSFSDHHLHNHNPQSVIPVLDVESYPITDYTNSPAPRLFSTHFARPMLPACMSSGKFVYVCRDPKDVLISKWHFMNKIRSKELPPLSLDEAFELFCLGVSDYRPFWEHVLSYWRASLENPNRILFLKYEELKEQPEEVVRKLAVFLGSPITAEEDEKGVAREIVKLCSFENMRNLEVNKTGVERFGKLVDVEKRDFFRKGVIGDWKNYLSEEMKARIDGITAEKFKGSGLIFTSMV